MGMRKRLQTISRSDDGYKEVSRMAPTDTKTAHTFSRHVAPFAPLVLALLLSRAVLPSGEEPPETTGAVAAAKCDDEVDNFQACHERFPTGCTQAGKYDAYV